MLLKSECSESRYCSRKSSPVPYPRSIMFKNFFAVVVSISEPICLSQREILKKILTHKWFNFLQNYILSCLLTIITLYLRIKKFNQRQDSLTELIFFLHFYRWYFALLSLTKNTPPIRNLWYIFIITVGLMWSLWSHLKLTTICDNKLIARPFNLLEQDIKCWYNN
jgi:hypothetical protein